MITLLAGPTKAVPVFFGPTAYTSSANTPAGLFAGSTSLEDFEDGTLDFDLTASAGGIITGNGANPNGVSVNGLTDSVDADDGMIDGNGTQGHSLFSGSGGTGIVITFQSAVTAAGMVWTDGGGLTTFEAFGPGMASLGTIGPVAIADGSSSGTTADDHFFGVLDLAGIVAIKLSNSSGGIEIDHIQFGAAVPEPSTARFSRFPSSA
jgi:hypothetical protein